MNVIPLSVIVLLVLFKFCSALECGNTVTIKPGDICWDLAIQHNVAGGVNGLLDLNPGLVCNNLQIGQVVCVGDGGIIAGCTQQVSIKPGDTCWDLSIQYSTGGLDGFLAMNPGIVCQNLQIGQRVCVSTSDAPQTQSPVPTTGCAQRVTVKSGDTCWLLSITYAIPGGTEGFIVLNPGINCGNLQVGQSVCVRASDGSATTAPVSPDPSPVECTLYVTVKAGDTCWEFGITYGIGTDGVIALNPGIICNSLQIGQRVCVKGPEEPTEEPSTTGEPLISKIEFVEAVTRNGYPTPTEEQYHNIISRAGTAGRIRTRRELAMFLANILHESDGLRAKEEYHPAPGAYQYPPLDVPGKKYHGRGYIQLTWSYNYKPASLALFGDLRLLNEPEQVATNDDIAWGVSFWFWSANVRNRPGVGAGHFGATVNAINGGYECNGGWNEATARKRFRMYTTIYRLWNIKGDPIETGCYN